MKQNKSKKKTLIIVLVVIFSLIFIFSLCSEDTEANNNQPSNEESPNKPESPSSNSQNNNRPSNNNNTQNNSTNNNNNSSNTADNNEPEPPSPPEPPKTIKSYHITYSAQLIENNSVGDTWAYGAYIGTNQVPSGSTITAELSAGPTLTLYATEDDANKDDNGSKNIVFSDLAINQEETQTVIVTVYENDGRYSGHSAKWEFTITCKRIENP